MAASEPEIEAAAKLAAPPTDRVTRNSPRKDMTPPPSANGSHPLGRRVHPGHHSPSPTTPPKLKKTPEKSSVSAASLSPAAARRRNSPMRTNKITTYFSPAVVEDTSNDVIEEDEEGFGDDVITFATPEELEEEDNVGEEDSSSGKENDDWRALSPRVLNLASTSSGVDAPSGSEHKDNVSSASNNSSSSPLQPRRVTRSRTAKAELSSNSSSTSNVASTSGAASSRTAVAAGSSSLYSLSPTRARAEECPLSKSPPHSPPTPHKINLLEERRSGSTEEPAAEVPADAKTAKRVISFASDEATEAAAAASDQSEASADDPPGSPNGVQKARRDLTRLLSSAVESDPTTGPKNRPNGVATTAEVVSSQVKTRSSGDNKEVPPPTEAAPVAAPAAAEKPGRRKGTTQKQQAASAAAAAAAAASRKVTDFFQVRRSSRKPKTEIKAQQQNEIETWLEMGESCDDSALGIGIQHYEGKGRGIEARKHFNKGDFVVEYAGDLMEGSSLAKQREEQYATDAATGCYMYYFRHGDKQYCIDATSESGRLGRLVNHSRITPNCQTKVVMVRDVPRLILVAKMDIEAGTELLYDYGDRSKESLLAHPWLAL